jgi:hypothetical protein
MTAILISMAIVAAEPQVHPLAKDKTGIKWVLPFSNALKTAESEKRLLMIKPVAFGTTPDGGW